MKRFPRYPARPHSGSGQARIWLGKQVYLGKHGSAESHQEYARLATLWANGQPLTPAPAAAPSPLTVAQLAKLWEQHAAANYLASSREPGMFQAALAPVLRLHGTTAAASFDARRLRQVRQAMLNGSWMTAEEKDQRHKLGLSCEWCRSYANRQVMRVRTVWRWAESEGLIPAGSWNHLRALPRIGGAEKARETDPREPVEWSQIEAVLPFLSPVVRAMLLLQWHTGMRPREVTTMKRSDVDTSGEVWTYTPTQHKTRWRGKSRAVAIGPQAQVVLAPWLHAAKDDAYIFPPAKQRQRQGYYATGYGQAIKRACRKAGIALFTPYCVRHQYRLRISREHGIEATRALMGHSSITQTSQYAAGQDLETAKRIAKQAG